MNKYERIPDLVLDLHGYTVREAERALHELLEDRTLSHVRVITGKGAFRESGPVLKTFVRDFLLARGISYTPAKPQNGGEGAYEVFLTKS